MEIEHVTFYAGPNRHTLRSAVEAVVRLGAYGREPSSAHPDFAPRLLAALPGLGEHVCSEGHRGGFEERMQAGTYLGHVAEHVALEILFQSGERGHYGKTREIAGTGSVRVIFESDTENGGRQALEEALRLVAGLWDGAADDDACAARLSAVVDRIRAQHLGPSTQAIVDAARARAIPVRRLDEGSLVRLGIGAAQRRVMAAVTDRTAVIGAELCQDKALTKTLLERQGIPVPPGSSVRCWEEALRAAKELGFPVAVKPQSGQQGRGVSTQVASAEELRRAFAWAQQQGETVLIEEQVDGPAYRVLVVQGQVVAASLRTPPGVEGDGIRSIHELVAQANADPRRRPGHQGPLSLIPEDEGLETALAHQGLSLQTVPGPGKKVWLRDTANLSSGGEAEDVTDALGPDFIEDMVRAQRALGLDIAGIDVITPDLGRSLAEAGGRVIEVNASPGLRMHLYPSAGRPRAVGEAIVESLFGQGTGRIPVCAVTGTNGKTTVTRMLAHIWRQTGKVVGMTTTDGIVIGQRQIQQGDLTGPWSAEVVLGDPTAEVAVLETARGGMARHGLGFGDCDVAVVTNIGPDHLGQDGISTLDDLTHLKALVVDVVRPGGAAVLNADDPRVAAMAARAAGRIVWFSVRDDNPLVVGHLASGGEAVVLSRGYLVHRQGAVSRRLIGSRALPAGWRGRAGFNVQNAMAAAAAALAMGLDAPFVGRSLASFHVDEDSQNPGRLEMVKGEAVDLLLDYAHNQPALAALGELIRTLGYRRVTTVLGLPGDRRNQELALAVREARHFSDTLIIREDEDLRGREPGEMARLCVDTLLEDGAEPGSWTVTLAESEAVARAVASAPEGSLVVVLFEHYETARRAGLTAMALRGPGAQKSWA